MFVYMYTNNLIGPDQAYRSLSVFLWLVQCRMCPLVSFRFQIQHMHLKGHEAQWMQVVVAVNKQFHGDWWRWLEIVLMCSMNSSKQHTPARSLMFVALILQALSYRDFNIG